ncbi:MAG: EamA family transporter [Myxococcota bacterium]|nr:EamA family transporter [Myxococcota bacterium]
MKNAALYVTSVLIWGSTWLAIRYQLGAVDPLASVAYRFLISGAILLIYCRARGMKLAYTVKDHLYFFLLAALLFSVNYWLVYLAEIYITSGLVAIMFTAILFFNVFFGALFLKTRIRWSVVAGGVVGIVGVGLIFLDEILAFDLSNRTTMALVWVLVGVIMASLGNIVSARNQQAGLPVLQTNAYSMIYGGLIMACITLVTGTPFTFDCSFVYIASLFYLAVFGSIVAFSAYLTLIGNIGADKAAYIAFLTPIIALALSTIFENYDWPSNAILGVALVTAGNFFAVLKKANS